MNLIPGFGTAPAKRGKKKPQGPQSFDDLANIQGRIDARNPRRLNPDFSFNLPGAKPLSARPFTMTAREFGRSNLTREQVAKRRKEIDSHITFMLRTSFKVFGTNDKASIEHYKTLPWLTDATKDKLKRLEAKMKASDSDRRRAFIREGDEAEARKARRQAFLKEDREQEEMRKRREAFLAQEKEDAKRKARRKFILTGDSPGGDRRINELDEEAKRKARRNFILTGDSPGGDRRIDQLDEEAKRKTRRQFILAGESPGGAIRVGGGKKPPRPRRKKKEFDIDQGLNPDFFEPADKKRVSRPRADNFESSAMLGRKTKKRLYAEAQAISDIKGLKTPLSKLTKQGLIKFIIKNQ